MKELALVVGVLVIGFVSAFVPVVSIELALVGAAATGSSGKLLAAQVLAAAAGQMVGKSCFFLGGRTAFVAWAKRKPHQSPRGTRVGALVEPAARTPAEAAADAGRIASEELEAKSDGHASAEYRRQVTGVVVRRALLQAGGGS